jgi:hypothetical protein
MVVDSRQCADVSTLDGLFMKVEPMFGNSQENSKCERYLQPGAAMESGWYQLDDRII